MGLRGNRIDDHESRTVVKVELRSHLVELVFLLAWWTVFSILVEVPVDSSRLALPLSQFLWRRQVWNMRNVQCGLQ